LPCIGQFLFNQAVLNPTVRDEIIQKIGLEIYRQGSCRLSQEELAMIYDGAVEDSERFACIRDIALHYHWAFELPGRMTSVTFKELPPLVRPQGVVL
jgi:hypothetical protein